jgi:hypothetical protein
MFQEIMIFLITNIFNYYMCEVQNILEVFYYYYLDFLNLNNNNKNKKLYFFDNFLKKNSLELYFLNYREKYFILD